MGVGVGVGGVGVGAGPVVGNVVGAGCNTPCAGSSTLHQVPVKVDVNVGKPHAVAHKVHGCGVGAGCGCVKRCGVSYAGGCGCGCSGGYGANGGGVTGGALGAGVGTGALNTGLGTGCDRPCGTTTTLHNVPLKVQVSVGHPHTVSHHTTGCNLSGTGCGSGCGGGCGGCGGGYDGGYGGSYGKRSVVNNAYSGVSANGGCGGGCGGGGLDGVCGCGCNAGALTGQGALHGNPAVGTTQMLHNVPMKVEVDAGTPNTISAHTASHYAPNGIADVAIDGGITGSEQQAACGGGGNGVGAGVDHTGYGGVGAGLGNSGCGGSYGGSYGGGYGGCGGGYGGYGGYKKDDVAKDDTAPHDKDSH